MTQLFGGNESGLLGSGGNSVVKQDAYGWLQAGTEPYSLHATVSVRSLGSDKCQETHKHVIKNKVSQKTKPER